MTEFAHITVLEHELVNQLSLQKGDLAIDCTAGGGGHTALLLKAVGPTGCVYAFDRDPLASSHLTKRFSKEIEEKNLILVPQPFSKLVDVGMEHSIQGKIAGICADIGVSSPQLDLAERGFSFAKEGPLDMRMDQRQELSAAHVVNEFSEQQLSEIFFKWGEEPKSRFVAKAIVGYRASKKIESTLELAGIVKEAIHYKKQSKKHPATKIFQALRIYVNGELDELSTLCSDAFSMIKPSGRLGIITFHSLEDRIVKDKFKELGQGKALPRHLQRAPLTQDQIDKLKNIKGRIIKPFPMIPKDEEQSFNPRSRSAKLRVIEKIG